MNGGERDPGQDRYEQIQQLFLDSLAIDPESAREEWVQHQTHHGDEVRATVLAMLRADAICNEGSDQLEPSLAAESATIDVATMSFQRCDPSLHSFANYEILEEIARGGMGVVYKAKQIRPSRLVAIKMIRSGIFATRTDIERFFVEAEAASQLDDESVVPVYEFGEVNGEPFMAMKFIDGDNLDVLLRKNTVVTPVFLKQLITVCRAVAVAHDRGIIHRDIKPSNILIDRTSGRPWITDFGLAKYLERDSSATAAGDVMGTPGYMAPELAFGDSNNATRAADVYGLGAVLYRGLAGRPPIPTDSVGLATVIQRIRDHEVLSPRSIERRVPQALNTICMKCLESDPTRRYPNAKELADDLQRFLDEEPIHAKPLSWTRRLHRWARHRPGLAVTWFGLAIFYLYHLLCYGSGLYPDPKFHVAATVVAATAAISAWVWQQLLTRTQGAAWVLYAWVTCDLALFTALLFWGIRANSSLVLLYHVIVAGSVLRCRTALVAYATFAAMISYGVHLVYLQFSRPQEVPEVYQIAPTLLSLFLIGIIQYFSLRRSAVSFESRRVNGPFG